MSQVRGSMRRLSLSFRRESCRSRRQRTDAFRDVLTELAEAAAKQLEELDAAFGPEHAGVVDPQLFARKHVVGHARAGERTMNDETTDPDRGEPHERCGPGGR